MKRYDFTLLTPPPVGEGEGDNWLNSRRGRITASKRAHTLIIGKNETLNSMMDEMCDEMRTEPVGFSNIYTEHGHAFEPQAINEYDMMRLSFEPIDRSPGMHVHPIFDIASATPDFFEGDETTGQVKCPFKLKNHNNLLHFGVRMVNEAYYTQVQFESFITGRPRIVFVSYHPEAPPLNQVYIELLKRDEAMHDKFLAKLEQINHMLVNDLRFDVKKSGLGVDGIPDLF